MDKKTLLVVFSLLALCFVSYKVGRSNGFNQGWDKGYIRGLDNQDNELEVSAVRP